MSESYPVKTVKSNRSSYAAKLTLKSAVWILRASDGLKLAADHVANPADAARLRNLALASETAAESCGRFSRSLRRAG
jgi:hypothetical protein